VEDRDAAVGAGPDPGLDLLQIPAAVLWVTEFRRGVLLICYAPLRMSMTATFAVAT